MPIAIPVSIIIPVYNESKHIKQLLDSCIIQNVKEIIIGDNGSTDNTGEICKEYAKNNPCIKYIRHFKTISPCANFWFLIKHATCEYYTLIGGHDFYTDKEHIKKLFKICKLNPEASGAYAAVKHFDENNNFIKYYHYNYAHNLESNSTYERINSLLHNLTDGSILFGLYKTENMLEIGKETNEAALIDILWIGLHLIKGKLIYAPNIFFGRRMTVRTDTEKYDWYAEVFNTTDFPELWLKQTLQLILKANFTNEQRNALKIKAMQQHNAISKAKWAQSPDNA